MNFVKEPEPDRDSESGRDSGRDSGRERGSHGRASKVRQLLCYICCGEFGTTSLKIHQKTCLKEHKWGLDVVLHDDDISKKEAAMNRKKCCEPGQGPTLPIPSVKDKAKDFDDYNASAFQLFSAHSEKCLYCRERNHDAIENARFYSQLVGDKQHPDEEEEERHREEEAERHRLEEERLKHTLEEEEAHRKAEEEYQAHLLSEQEAKRVHDEEVAAMEEASRLRLAEADREAEERHAEIEKNLRALKEKRNKALAAAMSAVEDVTRKHEIERQRCLEEEELLEQKRQVTEKRVQREAAEKEDRRMMRILKEEKELARRKAAEAAALEKRKATQGHRKFLRKHDGVLASSQSGLVYKDRVDDAKAMDDIAHMSLAHANHEHLIHPHHHLGGKSFHSSHIGCEDKEEEN